jgi:Rap1a immunity proteins
MNCEPGYADTATPNLCKVGNKSRTYYNSFCPSRLPNLRGRQTCIVEWRNSAGLDAAFRAMNRQPARGVTKLQITSGWRAAGILGSVLCITALPATGNAVVSEDTFLVRTTGDLVELCEATPAETLYTAAINFCHGFSSGVYRVLEEENMAASRRMFCMPDPGPHRNEAIAAFVKWVDANPNEKTHPPADGIASYLTKNFPCAHGKR